MRGGKGWNVLWKDKVAAHGEGFREVWMQPPLGGPFGLVSFGFAALLNMHRGCLGCKRSLWCHRSSSLSYNHLPKRKSFATMLLSLEIKNCPVKRWDGAFALNLLLPLPKTSSERLPGGCAPSSSQQWLHQPFLLWDTSQAPPRAGSSRGNKPTIANLKKGYSKPEQTHWWWHDEEGHVPSNP